MIKLPARPQAPRQESYEAQQVQRPHRWQRQGQAAPVPAVLIVVNNTSSIVVLNTERGLLTEESVSKEHVVTSGGNTNQTPMCNQNTYRYFFARLRTHTMMGASLR